jgi:hypothetical protein
MSDAQALVESIVRMSPPVALVAGLNAFMYFARRTPKMPKWLVPWIVMGSGAIIYPLITEQGEMIFKVPYPIVAQAITGLLVGFAAIGTHRIFEQTMWRFGYEKNGNSVAHEVEKHETDIRTRSKEKRHDPPDVGL